MTQVQRDLIDPLLKALMDHDPLPLLSSICTSQIELCLRYDFFFFATESIWDIMVMIMAIDRRTLHLLLLSIFPREDPAVCSWWRHPVNKPSAAVAPLKSRLILTAENKIEGIIKNNNDDKNNNYVVELIISIHDGFHPSSRM